MCLKNGEITLSTKFMGSTESYEDANIVMVGVPMDFTCSFRPGTRFGPQKIREVSIGIEEYSIYMDKSWVNIMMQGIWTFPLEMLKKALS